MTEEADPTPRPHRPLPDDDPRRALALARPEDPGLRRVGVAGDIYTILLSGQDTGGRYCLIDMFVPPGGGPPLHRHDFEEMFTVTEGEVAFTFRGEVLAAPAGTTVNVPANAPHSFANVTGAPARLLCMCTPSGAEEFFFAVGVPAAGRTAALPEPSGEELRGRLELLKTLGPKYRIELLPP